MSASYFVSLALASLVIAVPSGFGAPPGPKAHPLPGQKTCDLSAAKLDLPAGQTALATQAAPPTSLVLGIGYQNYTCTTAGNYTAAGAVADLYDLSCLLKNTAAFNSIQDIAYGAWKALPASVKTLGPTGAGGYPLLGSHFFIPNPSGTGLSPVWDYRAISAKGNPDAFVLAARVAGIPAPTGPKDVDWLQLKSVSGSLATMIYRTDTRGGPAPSSCTPGSAPISVKYVSKYWLYGGTVKV